MNIYQCLCGGSFVSVPISIVDKGVRQGIICFKLWCPSCGNSRLTDDGQIMYYTIRSDDYFSLDPLQFWVPESVQFNAKRKFLATVLKIADKHKFEGKINLTMNEIRQAYKENL